ncbi:phage integrase SAM-like domain-containing protein [Paludibacter jiangxiensis]|uniref:Phage integrase SAM-like domain-containing protein n=1 Tax=Paludibacter jiangxiensis TaxID=681398 RepID=A0A171ASM7_9BACT|nr:phage integrase SAM-like domain-containing protein [Paludibacter jiangxiensis]
MNASVSVVYYKSKILSNGEHPLMLQISKDGKQKYQSLGIGLASIHVIILS